MLLSFFFLYNLEKKKKGQLLGFDDYITPYAFARGQDILRGVNYASAAAGIREETGRQLVNSFLLKHSVLWFGSAIFIRFILDKR